MSQRPHPDRRTVVRGLVGLTGLAGALAAGACSQPQSAPNQSAGPTMAPDDTATTASGSSTTPTPSGASPSSLLSQAGPDIRTGPGTRSQVALTFHGAGDPALTARALQVAGDAHAHLTVFAVGQWLATTPQLGRDIVAAGHDLGNHSWSHQAMTTLSAAEAADEVTKGAAAVAASVGAAGLLFRPSGTPTSTPVIRTAAASAGYQRCVSYDVDPADYLDPGAELVRTRTLTAVRAGSIVSLHLGHPGTVDALPGILTGLAAHGLSAVRLTDLLSAA